MPRALQAFFAAVAIISCVFLAHEIGAADDNPCPKADEQVYQRFSSTMRELADNPVCDDLWERFRKSGSLAAAKWFAAQARHEGCW